MTPYSPKLKRSHESGFAAFGLALITTLLMFCGVCVTVAFHSASRIEAAQKLRLQRIRAAAREAELLNRISVNNALILLELSMALERFQAGHEPALFLQTVVPFWTSKPSEEIRSEPPAYTGLFQVAGENFAHHLRLAHNLSLDSAQARKELSERDASWGAGLAPGEPAELLCQVTRLAAEESSSRPAIPIPQAAGLNLPAMRLNADPAKCALTLKVLTGSATVYWEPEALAGSAPGYPQVHPRLIWVTPRAPLCRRYAAQEITDDPLQVARLFARTFRFKTGPGQIEIRHPDLQETQPHHTSCALPHPLLTTNGRLRQSDFLPLTPHWAPAYLTDQTGG